MNAKSNEGTEIPVPVTEDDTDLDVEGHLLGPDTYDARPQGGKPHDLDVER
jgi:hypothetical protein